MSDQGGFAERRFAYGADLLLAMRQSERPLSVSDLIAKVAGTELLISEVLAWLRKAEVSGLVEVAPTLSDDAPAGSAPTGARRVRLTEAGEAIAFGPLDRRVRSDPRG